MTGVQTCALPIFPAPFSGSPLQRSCRDHLHIPHAQNNPASLRLLPRVPSVCSSASHSMRPSITGSFRSWSAWRWYWAALPCTAAPYRVRYRMYGTMPAVSCTRRLCALPSWCFVLCAAWLWYSPGRADSRCHSSAYCAWRAGRRQAALYARHRA